MKIFIAFVFWIQLLCVFPFTESRWFRSTLCKADAKEPWTYRGKKGPKFWGDIGYPTCNAREQSPVAISRHNAVRDTNLFKLNLQNYDIPVTQATIENDGHTVQVTPTDGVSRSIFVNDATYTLMQFHFHWGDVFYRGAEHTIDGVQYAMEMHLVHQNDNNDIAVVGVFFQEQSQTSQELQKIINEFPKVTYKDQSTELRSEVNLNDLLPDNPSSFYRYQGSLTTPACDEGVTWSVLPKPLPVGISQDIYVPLDSIIDKHLCALTNHLRTLVGFQPFHICFGCECPNRNCISSNGMMEFRKLFSATKSDATPGCRLSNNYRPIQPLNDRTIYVSE